MLTLKPKFLGTIIKGRFEADSWLLEQRAAYLRGLEGVRVEEVIQKPVESKTLQQLRFFHGIVCAIASEASGYTRQEVKGLLKGEFLTQYIKSPTGKEVAWVPSLADLKKDVMSRFIDDCVILIAQHWSAIVPLPDTVVDET